jgi:phosphoribosylanthranilate isomerase
MTRIKICGITRKEDAFTAIEAGADALGFVFEPTSPRFVGDREEVRELLHSIPPFVTRVAVFGALPPELPAPALLCDALQFVEGTPPHTGQWLIKVLRHPEEASTLEVLSSNFHAFLIDAYSPHQWGGTGERADWDLARRAVEESPIPVILAGGLTPMNVGEAVFRVRPYAVDVSSGVEKMPGVKDAEKIVAFVSAVREAERCLEK